MTHFLLFFEVLGKAEGLGENWHGHVTAVTVAPEYRRIGLANTLMHLLEKTSEVVYVLPKAHTQIYKVIYSFVLVL